MNKPEKENYTHIQKYPRTTTINTVSSYAVSIRVSHCPLFADPCTYACCTSLQYCWRYYAFVS